MIPPYLPPVANHLWQSTLFATVAGLLTVALRRNRASVRYWLWLATSVKFLIPFALLVTIGSQFERRAAPSAAPKTILLPLTSAIDEVVQPVALGPGAPPATSYVPAISLFIWLSGSLIVVFSWARRWRGIRAILRAAAPLALTLPSRSCLLQRGSNPECSASSVPFCSCPKACWTIWRPSNGERSSLTNSVTFAAAIIWTAAIHMAVEAVFWFHPLVWWIGRRLMEERERACDEEAQLASGDRQAYAEGILAVCMMYLESPLACVSGVTGSNLKKRIRGIMENRLLARLSLAKKAALALAGVVAVTVPIAVGVVHAQSKARPAFEAASVKPVDPSKTGGFDHEINRERFVLTSHTLGFIVMAYNLNSECAMKAGAGENCPLILGAPEWARGERFEIRAKLPEGSPDYTGRQFNLGQAPQLGLMIQSLLEERFKLKIHRETRELPVYVLTTGKNRPKLKQAVGPAVVKTAAGESVVYPGGMYSMFARPSTDGTPGRRLEFKNSTMQKLAHSLAIFVDRPILDGTGLKGEFDFTIEYEVDATAPGGDSSADLTNPIGKMLAGPGIGGPALFTAIQEQLGLKLESTKAPVEVLVIDRLERPSEN